MALGKTCWGITDGHPGMVSQVLGLAEAVGLPTELKTCRRRAPWVYLPARFSLLNPLNQLTTDSDSLDPPWPDLLITCGRRQLPYALWIREHAKGKTFCVHIQNPRIPLNSLDLILAPEHDNISGPNVISTRGAIHKVTPEKLKEAACEWSETFSSFPKTYHVVLLGGSTHRFTVTEKVMKKLIAQIQEIASQTEGSVLVTPSYRTPYLNLLRSRLQGMDRVYLADLSEVNPYMGMLGLADYLYVTNDSVNMMCEANITGKPLHLLVPEGHENTTPARFSQQLIKAGIARVYSGTAQNWTYVPLNDTVRAAAKIRQSLGLQ